MSYDVDVMGASFNYTSNLAQFFIAFDMYPRDWDGMPRAAVGAKIVAGLAEVGMHDIAELKTKYDSDNEWGDVVTAIRWLEDIRDTCLLPIDEIVHVT